jgi:hypothetical protein
LKSSNSDISDSTAYKAVEFFCPRGLAEFRRRSGEREFDRFWSDMCATKTLIAQQA